MIQLNGMQRKNAAPFFEGREDTLIRSCLEGHLGEVWADAKHPSSVWLKTADFSFVGGRPDREIVDAIGRGGFTLIADPSREWASMLKEVYGTRLCCFSRYAFYKDPSGFCRRTLREFVDALPAEYRICRFDEALYQMALSEEWSRDFCSNFLSAKDYLVHGVGFGILYNGKLVSGASSYSWYEGGIEIEIDTHPDFRQKGLAIACAAALILDCLERGIYPSWDAANLVSRHLAERLGYRFSHEYDTYTIRVLSHRGTRTLFTERLELRPFQLTDDRAVYENWAKDPEVARYLTWRAHSNIKVTQGLLDSWCHHYTEKTYNWAIVPKELGEPVGSIGVVHINEDDLSCTIGYALSRQWWGRGITAEAGRMMLQYLFHEVGFWTVTALHHHKNRNSGRVMQKLGMRYLRTRNEEYQDNQGRACPVLEYRITREEFDRLVIRPAYRNEVPEVGKLYYTLTGFLESHTNYPGWHQNIYPNESIAEDAFRCGSLHVAVQYGRVVGSVILFNGPDPDYQGVQWKYPSEYELIIHTLAVHPDFNRQGIGGKLLEYAERMARQKGMDTVRLDVSLQNSPAIRLYESHGYQRLTRLNLGANRGGQAEWYYLYEKLLER